MKKYLSTLALLLAFTVPSLVIPTQAVAARAPVTLAVSFDNATGLKDISKESNSGLDTDKLGIYGPGPNGEANLISIISNIINSVFLLLGFTAVVLLIIEGVLLILARENEERKKKVLATIINIAIGFGVILLSYAIVDQILRVLGDTNIDSREQGIEQTVDLANQIGIGDLSNMNQNATLSGLAANYAPCSVSFGPRGSGNLFCNSIWTLATSGIPQGLYTPDSRALMRTADRSKEIFVDSRSVDLEFVIGESRIPATRGQVLRFTKAEWDKVKNSSFNLFVPSNADLGESKAWVTSGYSYGIPLDAITLSSTIGSSPSGSEGKIVNLSGIVSRIQEGVQKPNVIQVRIPNMTTANITVVVLAPGEEDAFLYTPSEAFADYDSTNPTSSGSWADVAAGTTLGYDRRKSFFTVKNKTSTLDVKTYTTGATIQLNDGSGDVDIEAEITLDDKNQLPATFQAIEHTIRRGDGVLVKDSAKSGDKVTVTIPVGQNTYVLDDITAILKDGKRVNIGTNTITIGNNSSPRLATLSGIGQVVLDGSYNDISGNKTVKLMPNDSISLMKSGEEPAKMSLDLKYYTKEAPNLIDIVSTGFDGGFVRFTDGEISQSGNALNGVTPFSVKSELSFDEPGVYPVSIAIRDYTIGRTLGTMQFTVSVVTDGTSLEVSPNYSGIVGGSYRMRTFPAFASNSKLESKRVEIIRMTDTGSGGQTVHNRTLTQGIDDFEYIFDQDGEYTIKLYNKFNGGSTETQVAKQIVVLPQSPQVDFEIKEKSGNPTVFELVDLSKYVDSGTVFVDFSPFDAGITQSDWQTSGSKRVKTLTFSKPGTYRVTVSGRNRFGEVANKSRDITISTDVTYDIQLQDAQGNTFPQNQTPRFIVDQPFTTKVTGKNISKVEVSYGSNNQPLLTMTNATTQSDGMQVFTGNIKLAEKGPYSLTYAFYSVTRPTEKALVVTKSVLIRRTLEPLADFSVTENGAVLSPTPGLCSVGGSSREGYAVKKNMEYSFDGSASLASSDLPVNRDATNMTFRWNMGSQQLASKTVTIRDRFTTQSADSSSCIPVTFTILETVTGQAKTSQLIKYFKVENSLPTYDSFVVEWPTGTLTTPLSVKAKLRGLRDADEPSQNIQVLWFYEIQGSQLFNEVSYDTERIIRIENYGAEGSSNTVRIGAQIFDMNTKESVKVYSDQRSLKTGTNPALRTSLVNPQVPQGLSYVPWIKGNSPLNIQISSALTDGAALQNPDFSWSRQRYGTFSGCESVPEDQAAPINGTAQGASASFPLCGLYRITAVVSANGQRSQQTLAVKVYENETLLSEVEKPAYLAVVGLRGSSGEATATYVPVTETTTSPFFPSGTGTVLLTNSATYSLGLSKAVANQAVTNGSYTGSGAQLSANYDVMYDMLTSYNLPDSAIYDRLAQDNPAVAEQLKQLRASGKNDNEVRDLLARNLAGSSINYDPNSPYNVPFGTAYDVYTEFGLRPAATLDKLSKDDAQLATKVKDLRSSGASDESIVQSLRNEGNNVQTNLHEPTEMKASEVGTVLTAQGLSLEEIVDKLILDNPDLSEQRADFLASLSIAEMLEKVEAAKRGLVVFQPLAPIRMKLSRAYQVMRERAYTDALILDKLLADDPTIKAEVSALENRGVATSSLLRELLTDPSREVSMRVSGAIRSNFQTVFATLKRHGLSTESIYEKMTQDDEVFRVVYEAAKKKTSDMSGYYQEFVQEPTLYTVTYKPESTFVLSLRLAYAEYIAMGFSPTETFERIARDNPNFGTDYETLKREKAEGIEMFESLVRNGANRKVRFSYMKSFDLGVSSLPAFFQRQGLPPTLAIEKVVQDNPQLARWYKAAQEGDATPTFASLEAEFPRATFAISPFTGWNSTLEHVGASLSSTFSPSFAVEVLAGSDMELSRFIDTLRGQSKSDDEVYIALREANKDRLVRLYPYISVPVALNEGARLLSTVYPSDHVVLSHLARFDDSFGDFYSLAQDRLYSSSATLARVGTREVFMAAFRPVLADAGSVLQSIEMTGLSLKDGLALYAGTFPEIENALAKSTADSALIAQIEQIYPVEQKIPLNVLFSETGLEKIRANLGWTKGEGSLKEYLVWLRGWGISSDIALAQLAISSPEVAVALKSSASQAVDARMSAVESVVGQIQPDLHKRFSLSFVDAYRTLERRGLSTSWIYGFMAAQDPVFQSVYEEQRLARTSERALYDIFKENEKTKQVLINPLLPARLSTAYVARLLVNQNIPSSIVAKKLATDQPALASQQALDLNAVLTSVAQNAYLQTTPFSLTRPIQLTPEEQQSLLESYGVSAKSAASLSKQTGSGMTLPPQVTVNIETYVEQAQEQGIGRQQILEDVMRLIPEKADALRALGTQEGSDQVSTLASSLSTALDQNVMLPLLTKNLPSTSDEPTVLFGALVNGGLEQLSGYIPGTMPLSTGSGAFLTSGEDIPASLALGEIKQSWILPGGFAATLFNSRLASSEDAFRYQSASSLQGIAVIDDTSTVTRLSNLLSASGSILRGSASSANDQGSVPNVFGIAGETTLLDCASFAVVMTETGEQTLVCSASSLYEASMDTYKTVLLRILGEGYPEELSTLIASFDRAQTLEDRLEAMTRLRERTSRLAINAAQREDLQRRLSFVKIFELSEADANQLAKRNADALLQRLDSIIDAAGTSMVTDRGSIAEAFGGIASQNEVASVLLVRYTLAVGDLLRSQTVDSAVKDLVVQDFIASAKELTNQLLRESSTIAGVASPEFKKKLEDLNTKLTQPKYTYLWISDTVIRAIREFTEIPSLPDSGKIAIQDITNAWVKAQGQKSAQVMREGIPAVAGQNSARLRELMQTTASASIWNRQLSGVVLLTKKLSEASTYTAGQKQEILEQLYTARKTYLTDVQAILTAADFSPAAKATLLKRTEASINATNITSMLELESALWQSLEAEASLAESSSYVALWEKTAEYQVQFYRATANVLPDQSKEEVLPYFEVIDLSTQRQTALVKNLSEAIALPLNTKQTSAFESFATAASIKDTPLAAIVADFELSRAQATTAESLAGLVLKIETMRVAVLKTPDLTEQEKVRFGVAHELLLRRLVQSLKTNNEKTGIDLLANLRTTVQTRLSPIVVASPGLRASAHVVHDLKKVVLAHPELPLQYKLEMLFEMQQAYPFYPFTRAFTLCTPIYVKDSADVVRRVCAEEAKQESGLLPVEKAQLFALMQSAASSAPQIRSASLLDMVTTTVSTLTKDQDLSLAARQQYLSALAQSFEWPDVSFTDRNTALAYIYSLPVISDEMLQLQETRLSLETYYISLGELESRLRAIMLGVNELPDALKGAVRESLMQVKKHYAADTQRSNIMLSLAANVIRGSELGQGRKDMLVRVLDTLGDTVQTVPVEKLLPEVSLEQIDAHLAKLSSVPTAEALFADREDIQRLLSQNDILGSVGALARFEDRISTLEGLSPEERADLGFYTTVARNFLVYVQSQGPRTQDIAPEVNEEETVVDPVAPTEQPQVSQPNNDEPSMFWAILWGIVYFFSAAIVLVFVLGIVLYFLFLAYKKSHPDIHVDFEEYILVLRGQLGTFFKRFSKQDEINDSIYRVPDEALPQKPEEVEEEPVPTEKVENPEKPEVSESPSVETKSSEAVSPATQTPPVQAAPMQSPQTVQVPTNTPPPVQEQQSPPSWMQLGDSHKQSTDSSVNPSGNVQSGQNEVQSSDTTQQ